MMFQRFSRPLRSIHALGLVAALGLAAIGVQAAEPKAPGGPDAPPAHGRPGPGPGMPRGPMMMDGRLLKEVGASDAQRAQIKQIFEVARNDLKGQHDTERQLHEQLQAQFAAPTLDTAAIESLRQQIAAQHEVVSKRLTQAAIDAAKVLTAEQRAKAAEQFKKHRARMEERVKHMMEHGGRAGRGEGSDLPPPPPSR
ncbi:Spy/CpxP family protein refolding chaperone [Roseateles amylovorans]|uniref:Spy/CpxP family protein refolding chaperone n=1 Tax=Roseateles amylovorans TaxID=2978473 RepID=A0ABY6B4V7_9BURK|nr:Spy/CpxP family protein refolding chaperone [Roseateles amylovorans]UXH80398.1 Spy/CpxP family protein refolding chaperone [Roseateles amylovorans]